MSWSQHGQLCFEHFVIYLELSLVHHSTMHFTSLILMIQDNSRGIWLHPLLSIIRYDQFAIMVQNRISKVQSEFTCRSMSILESSHVPRFLTHDEGLMSESPTVTEILRSDVNTITSVLF